MPSKCHWASPPQSAKGGCPQRLLSEKKKKKRPGEEHALCIDGLIDHGVSHPWLPAKRVVAVRGNSREKPP